MTPRTFATNMLGQSNPEWRLVLGTLLLISLSNCLTPSPTTSPTPAETSAPALEISAWQFSGDFVTPDDAQCAGGLPAEGFILGMQAGTCAAGQRGGAAVTTITLPPAPEKQVVVVQLTCAGSGGCAGGLASSTVDQEISLLLDGDLLWSFVCQPERCNTQGLGDHLAFSFVTQTARVHQVELRASPNTTWEVSDFQVAYQPLPASLHGMAYSPYRDCQNPHWGPYPVEDEVSQDLSMLRHMTNGIRTYGSTGISGEVPLLAQQAGLAVSAGAWLSTDESTNEEEIDALIDIANSVPLESVIAGNEVLLRGDLSEDQLLSYIQRVKESVQVPVTTAETYAVLLQHPRILDEVDYVMVHIHPYWDGVSVEEAAPFVLNQYLRVQSQAGGKRVVIGETGWPSAGPQNGMAIPGQENQRRFLSEFLALAEEHHIEFYYFDAYDEMWKSEGGAGPNWGMAFSDRSHKYDIQSLLLVPEVTIGPLAGITPVPAGTAQAWGSSSTVFAVYSEYAAETNHFTPSGWMGDLQAIHFSDCSLAGSTWGDTLIEIGYSPQPGDLEGWAGMYWLQPENNWGNLSGGYDLSGYSQLTFQARSARDGARVRFFVGGISAGAYPSSIGEPVLPWEADGEGFVTLTTEWQEFHVDLRNLDLSHVIDGFGWMAERTHTPDGVTFYLDDIRYEVDISPLLQNPPPATSSTTPAQLAVYSGTSLSSGFEMGVDSSSGRYDWLWDRLGYMQMDYPAGETWGVVYITVGKPAARSERQGRDFSGYTLLSVEMRGEKGGERVSIGIKDKWQADNGSETEMPVVLSEEWETYTFALGQFGGVDLENVYIPIEFVFEPGVPAETVYFRNVYYLMSLP